MILTSDKEAIAKELYSGFVWNSITYWAMYIPNEENIMNNTPHICSCVLEFTNLDLKFFKESCKKN